jgi:hypothetical protein
MSPSIHPNMDTNTNETLTLQTPPEPSHTGHLTAGEIWLITVISTIAMLGLYVCALGLLLKLYSWMDSKIDRKVGELFEETLVQI